MPLSETIHKERYAQHGEEVWADTAKRVAKSIAKAEKDCDYDKWEEEFNNALLSFDFIPGGRILANAGKPKPFMMNCFVVDTEDSRESIGEMLKDILIISGTGGGVGISFSKLRPKGVEISTNGGFSSGPISFMECADMLASTIKTGGGRRAALLLGLSVYHPDIMEFLHYKLDLKKLNNANISVEIDNKFIQAVKDNADWDLVWAGKVHKIIKAKELWDKMVENSWRSGEPGILNMGYMKQMSNSEFFAPVVITNPCQPETALFLTNNRGIQQLKNIKIGDIIWTGKQWSKLVNKWATGIKAVYRYTTSNGYFTECTENHRIVENGIKKEIKDAEKIDYALGGIAFDGIELSEDFAILAGLIQGDGSMQKNGGVSSYLNVGEKDQEHRHYIEKYIDKEIPKTATNTLWKIKHSFSDLYLEYAPLPERSIPEFWLGVNSKTMCAFLKGLYSANGSVIKSVQRITLKSTNKKLIQTVQIMLSSVGIKSYYTTNKTKEIKWSNGVYRSKESYDLNISSDRLKFKKLIGFTQQYKMENIDDNPIIKNNRISTDIINKEFLGNMEVFDYTVEAEEHTIWQNGLLLSNCGEVPLSPFESCCLGSVNVSNFVKEKNLDRKRFEKAIEVGIRFLDNVLTLNEYPLGKIHSNVTAGRRIGLGIMGLHYAMLKLGIRYSSEEGVSFTEKVYEILRNHSYWVSSEIAKERGSFPKFNPEMYLKNNFVKTLPTKIRDKIREDGMRNVCVNSQAPTGTSSILANVSSGIEPIFSPVYERTFWSQEGKETVQKKEIVADELFTKWIEEGKDISHFEGSHDISPEWHLLIQEAAQRYVDNALSKTINIPEDYPMGDLSELLLKYIPNLKGVTVYRDGSRGNSPLKPLDSEKYFKKRNEEASDIGKMVDCATGTCEI